MKGRKYSVTNVPRVPRNFIYRVLAIKNSRRGIKVAHFCRRMFIICFNGGIPVHLLEFLKIKNNEKKLLASTDFEQVVIDFSRSNDLAGEIEIDLRLPLENFKNYLLESSSEADYRSLFWDVVVESLFMAPFKSEEPVLFRLTSEWSTRQLFPDLDDRYPDFVCLTKPHEKEIAILLIEVGKEPFDLKENPHKDFSKLLSILSLNCVEMALELVAKGKKPELARVYGLWIGGHQIQFCVAHPVVTLNDEGKYEIHANLSFFPHWKFDLLSPDVLSCDSCCCKVSNLGSEFETLIPGCFHDLENLSSSNFVFAEEEIDLETEEVKVLSKFSKSEQHAVTNPETKIEKVKLYKGFINVSVLKKLKVFIECIKSRIVKLNSADSENNEISRTFSDQKSGGLMSRSRPSSFQKTPCKDQIIPENTSIRTESESPLRQNGKGSFRNSRFKLTKKSTLIELEMFRRLSMFPLFFPKVYSVNRVKSLNPEGDLVICYELEEMISIFDKELQCENFIDGFVECLVFATHCLHGLYLLHKVLGVIHSDISPANIMFSNLHNVWKISDFNQSMGIDESSRTRRTGGTLNYVDPVARESGIFTEASDVFSLGQVILNIFYPSLVDKFVNSDEIFLEDQALSKLFSEFESIMCKMILHDPNSRPTVILALEGMFKILEEFNFDTEDLVFSSVQFIIEQKKDNGRDLENISEKIENVKLSSSLPNQPVLIKKEEKQRDKFKKAKLTQAPPTKDEESNKTLFIKNVLQK